MTGGQLTRVPHTSWQQSTWKSLWIGEKGGRLVEDVTNIARSRSANECHQRDDTFPFGAAFLRSLPSTVGPPTPEIQCMNSINMCRKENVTPNTERTSIRFPHMFSCSLHKILRSLPTANFIHLVTSPHHLSLATSRLDSDGTLVWRWQVCMCVS